MESRYYTYPNVQEFRVDFEYEYKEETTEEWIKTKVEADDLFHDNWDIYNKRMVGKYPEIRVKYLDREDIESLGFKEIEDQGMSENSGMIFRYLDKRIQKGYYNLFYWPIVNRIRIDSLVGTIFDGNIKNKSELKVLLKQLGVQ